MSDSKRQLLARVLRIFDLALILTAFLLAAALIASKAGPVSAGRLLSARVRVADFLFVAVALSMWPFLFSLCGLYQSKRLLTRRALAVECAKATTLCSVCAFLAGAASRNALLTLQFAIYFWLLSTTLVIAGRLGFRQLAVLARRRGRNLRFILI
ncbi:MAG: hypothetical protein ACRD5L_16330, partial [Bryobacteraceae bacterium]